MDRKQFLKTVCGLGACGCLGQLTGVVQPLEAAAADQSDQRLAFARYQMAKLVGFMAASPRATDCVEIVEKTGRECAKRGQIGTIFKNDPERYFDAARKAYGTEFAWDKEKHSVTVTIAEGECGCPLVDAKRTPAFWCNCSVGYQHEAFEGIFGSPVKVSLKESKLAGSKHCVFEVRLA